MKFVARSVPTPRWPETRRQLAGQRPPTQGFLACGPSTPPGGCARQVPQNPALQPQTLREPARAPALLLDLDGLTKNQILGIKRQDDTPGSGKARSALLSTARPVLGPHSGVRPQSAG